MSEIIKYSRIFFSVYLARIGKDLSLPMLNQMFAHMGSLCFFSLHLFSFALLISRFSFTGWSTQDLWVLLFVFEAFTYLSFFLFWKGYNETVRDISSGGFDLVLSKPISTILTTFCRGGGFHNIFSAFLGLIFLCINLLIYHQPTIFSVILFLLTFIVSLWTVFCISIIFISLNFKFGRLDSTPGMTFQVQEVYKYPSTAYTLGFSCSLFLIVFSLFTTYPTLLLLSRPVAGYLTLIYWSVALASTVIGLLSWHFGLRHYSSAS